MLSRVDFAAELARHFQSRLRQSKACGGEARRGGIDLALRIPSLAEQNQGGGLLQANQSTKGVAGGILSRIYCPLNGNQDFCQGLAEEEILSSFLVLWKGLQNPLVM